MSAWRESYPSSVAPACWAAAMVLDNELLAALERFTREITVDQATIGLETILEAGPGGQYLDRMHTARHFRDEIWMPSIWSQEMTQAWVAGGRQVDVDRARDIVMEVASRLAHEPIAPQLTPSAERQILTVIDEARRGLVG